MAWKMVGVYLSGGKIWCGIEINRYLNLKLHSNQFVQRTYAAWIVCVIKLINLINIWFSIPDSSKHCLNDIRYYGMWQWQWHWKMVLFAALKTTAYENVIGNELYPKLFETINFLRSFLCDSDYLTTRNAQGVPQKINVD